MSQDFTPGTLIVSIKSNADIASLSADIVARGGNVGQHLKRIGIVIIGVPAGYEQDWIDWLNAREDILGAMLNGRVELIR
ncbi:MAG: hypothetical protein V1738_04300 [Patescibacteria group bacterium]